jgi:flavodoxin I
MNVLVVYDSYFGNTEKTAHAIGGAFSTEDTVRVVHVKDFASEMIKGIDLLVVGSPTRAFRPTKALTAALGMLALGSLKGVKVAVFDTRVSLEEVNSKVLNFMVNIFGYAAQPIARLLKRKGGVLVCEPEGFIVNGKEGPLKDGELERAAEWIEQAKTMV